MFTVSPRIPHGPDPSAEALVRRVSRALASVEESLERTGMVVSSVILTGGSGSSAWSDAWLLRKWRRHHEKTSIRGRRPQHGEVGFQPGNDFGSTFRGKRASLRADDKCHTSRAAIRRRHPQPDASKAAWSFSDFVARSGSSIRRTTVSRTPSLRASSELLTFISCIRQYRASFGAIHNRTGAIR